MEGDILKSKVRFETERNRVHELPLNITYDQPDQPERNLDNFGSVFRGVNMNVDNNMNMNAPQMNMNTPQLNLNAPQMNIPQ